MGPALPAAGCMANVQAPGARRSALIQPPRSGAETTAARQAQALPGLPAHLALVAAKLGVGHGAAGKAAVVAGRRQSHLHEGAAAVHCWLQEGGPYQGRELSGPFLLPSPLRP